MAGARAGAIVRQQQRQCQSLMRMRKGEVSSKNMYMTWLPIRGATKWNTADWSDGACRGVCMSARGAMKWDKAERSDSDGACRGASCMSVREATKWNTEDPLDGACRGTRKSVSGATKWNTADQSNGACRGVRTSEEDYHAENGAHQLNLLLLNKLSSIFVFVITYHAARQIIERPCHLLSHAVHNSKLTTLPQSKRRWQPSWQRMLEARQIIERLAKDHVTVTLFQNMTWFILGYA